MSAVSTWRRRAGKVGLRFYKSNWRKDSIDNHGGYRVIATDSNTVVDGSRFNLELCDVTAIIEDWEAA